MSFEAITAAQRRLNRESVPAGWTVVHLGDIFEPVIDTGHKHDLPVLSVMVGGRVVRRSSLGRRSDREVAREKYLRVLPGDIAYNTMRMWQGASGLVGEEGYISPAYTVCRPRSGEAPEFWAAYFQYKPMIRAFLDHSQGFAKDRYRLYYHNFATVPALRPPLIEQRRIAAALSSIDATIEDTKGVTEQIHAAKKAAMKTVFRTNQPKVEDASSWGLLEISKAGTWMSGGTPRKNSSTLWSGSIPWVSPKDMKRPLIWDTIDHVSEEAIGNGTRLVPAGTILVVVRGMILAHSFPVALTRVPVCFNQDMKALKPSQDFEPEFLLHWLTHVGPAVLAQADASTHGTRRVPTETLLSMKVPVPPRKEQRKIATFLTSLDDLAETNRDAAEALRTFKVALLTSLLSGGVSAPTEAAP